MYHKKNVDYAYFLWEDFVYQVENKNVKRSNEIYYPRFTKVIVNFFMTKDSSILRRNKKTSNEEDDDEVAMGSDDDDDADNQDDDDNNDDDQNDDNTDNENDDNDDDDDGQDHEEDNEEEGSDQRFQTPSHYESTDDEESDEVTHGRMLREKNWMKKRQIKRTKTTSKAEVLARSSNESKTSYAIAANLSKLELKKILIDKMESNNSIHRSDEQKNLYKAFVDAYKSAKLILDTYGDTVTFIRHQDDEDKRTEENPRWINTGGNLTWSENDNKSYGIASNRGINYDATSKCIIIAVTKLQIVEWHNYKHLDWITVCRDDDKLYKFKEGDFNKLRIQDIEDMLLLLVQGKLTNLTVKECLAFNNKDKKNKLMHIDELHKFSDGTLNDVRTALNDRLNGIQMKYLPQTIQRQSDRDKVGAMIHAIDKQLKTRRIMRSLEKFVGGQTLYFNPMILAKTEGINPKNTPLDSVEVLKDMIQKEKKKIGTSIMPTEMDLNTGTT
ncbi:hypothetical protein Tco_1577902 [Tanacetum coccineum]